METKNRLIRESKHHVKASAQAETMRIEAYMTPGSGRPSTTSSPCWAALATLQRAIDNKYFLKTEDNIENGNRSQIGKCDQR